MSKKLFYIILSAALGIFLISLLGYYFILQGNAAPGENNGSIFRNFFPFGGDDLPEPTQPTQNGEEEEVPQNQNFAQKLRKLSVEQVAGAGVLDAKAGTIVRYMEKATGHIYEVELFSPNKNRLSNTTMPVAHEALWGNTGLALFARYLKEDDVTIESYALTMKEVSTTTDNTVTGVAFPNNTLNASVFGSSVFYLEKTTAGSSGSVSTLDGKTKRQIWTSPLSELLSQYVNTSTVSLATKPAAGLPGFMFLVNTSSGAVRTILANVPGLSTLTNDDASKVLYLQQGGGVFLGAMTISSRATTVITPITFPEKCVWSKKDKNILYCAVPKENISQNSLTSWYQGMILYNDDIWKYDIANNTTTLVLNLTEETGEGIDVIQPILSENEQYLVFMNKRDNTLWSLDLLQ